MCMHKSRNLQEVHAVIGLSVPGRRFFFLIPTCSTMVTREKDLLSFSFDAPRASSYVHL